MWQQHRFLGKIVEGMNKGINSFFFYGMGIGDTFFFNNYLGVRELEETLRLFCFKNQIDVMVTLSEGRFRYFKREFKNREVDFRTAFRARRLISGFGARLNSDREHREEAQEQTEDIANQSERENVFIQIERYAQNNRVALFIPNLEWEANLYDRADLQLLRKISEFERISNLFLFTTIKDINLLKNFNFETTTGPHLIYIGGPTIEEVINFLIRQFFIEEQFFQPQDIKEIATGLQGSGRKLREIVRLFKNKIENNKSTQKFWSSKDFEDTFEQKIEEKVTLNDVVIEDEIKKRIRIMLDSFINSKENVQRGMILYGPPGTGKTLIAKAIANEYKMHFLAPTLAEMKGQYIGESSAKIHELFERARANSPTVLFLDELDTLFPHRGGDEMDKFTQDMVNQFLVEIDGATSQRKKVFVIGATNRLETVDLAVRSRLNNSFQIKLPGPADREAIFNYKLDGFNFSEMNGKDEIVAKTEGFSGRDIETLVTRVKQIEPKNSKIRFEHFQTALQEYERDKWDEFLMKMGKSVERIEGTKIFVNLKDVFLLSKKYRALLKTEGELVKNKRQLEFYRSIGVVPKRGYLIYGEEGTGKEFIGKAIAGQFNFDLVQVNSEQFILETPLEGLKKMTDMFEYLYQLSQLNWEGGIVLLFKNIEFLLGPDGRSPTILKLELLSQLEKLKSPTSRIIIVATTTRLENLDSHVYQREIFENYIPRQPISTRDAIEVLRKLMERDNYIRFEMVDDQPLKYWIEEEIRERGGGESFKIKELIRLKDRIKIFYATRNGLTNGKILIR